MSVKKAIVNKVKERIEFFEKARDPSATCLPPVFKNPFREVDPDAEIPCYKVALIRGKTERITNAIEYEWTDQLIIAYIAQGNEGDLEDELYDRGEELAAFLIGDENNSENPNALHHLVSDLVLTDWDMDLKTGATGTGAIVLKFDLTYHIKYEMEFGPLAGFNVTVKHTEAGEHTEPVAVFTIDLPQS